MPKYYEMSKIVKLKIKDDEEKEVIALVSFASTKKHPKGSRVVKYFLADIFGEIKQMLNIDDNKERWFLMKVWRYNDWSHEDRDWKE